MLSRAALLIAEAFDDDLDVSFHAGRIERLGDEARRRIAGTSDDPEGNKVRAGRLLRLLFDEVGFAGNRADYYDPRNSFLHHVLDRRLGIPISLAVILIEVARHAGVRADGIGFPGHFLVRLGEPVGESSSSPMAADLPIVIDPFGGRLLEAASLRALNAQVTGSDGDPDPRLLLPCTSRRLLTRMLGNLRGIYRARGDQRSLLLVLERLAVLTPGDEDVTSALAALAGPPPPRPAPLKN